MAKALFQSFQDWHPFLFILLAGALPTQMWRWLGVVLSRSLDEEGEFLRWVKAVATSLVAGLIANLVVFPAGALQDIPIEVRLAALVIGYAVYLIRRTHILWGIVTGEVILLAGAFYVS